VVSATTWRFLEDCIGNEKVLKSLLDTRLKAQVVELQQFQALFSNAVRFASFIR